MCATASQPLFPSLHRGRRRRRLCCIEPERGGWSSTFGFLFFTVSPQHRADAILSLCIDLWCVFVCVCAARQSARLLHYPTIFFAIIYVYCRSYHWSDLCYAYAFFNHVSFLKFVLMIWTELFAQKKTLLTSVIVVMMLRRRRWLLIHWYGFMLLLAGPTLNNFACSVPISFLCLSRWRKVCMCWWKNDSFFLLESKSSWCSSTKKKTMFKANMKQTNEQ